MTTTAIGSGRSNPEAPRGSAVATQISLEMKSKLNALAEDADLLDNARRAVRKYLTR